MRRLAQVALVAVLGVGLAGEASAQVMGIPYYVNPKGGTGILAAANVGSITSPTAAKGVAAALTGGIGAGPLFLTASISQFNPKGTGSNISSYGATAGMQVFGGPLVPLTIGVQAGYGTEKIGGTTFSQIPIAVGVGINVPLFPIKPWIAPRVELDHAGGGGGNVTRTGVSAGVDFNLLLGLGVHAGVDYLMKKTSGATTYAAQTTIGVGAHFHFSVPMM